jgi:hypothetical protein
MTTHSSKSLAQIVAHLGTINTGATVYAYAYGALAALIEESTDPAVMAEHARAVVRAADSRLEDLVRQAAARDRHELL